MAAEYSYRVSAWRTSGRTGLAMCASAPTAIPFSVAPGLDGGEGRWTPEQFLLCALASCFTTTFQDVAHSAKFDYTDLEVEVEGNVQRDKRGCDFSEITIRPRLMVHSEEEFEAGLRLLRRTKAVCPVSRSINVPQLLEPRVEAGKMPAVSWKKEDTAAKAVV
jgi:organic hydroperoxide reductase OsmC/OhrA